MSYKYIRDMLAGMKPMFGLVGLDNSLEMVVRQKTFICPKLFKL